MQFFYVYQLISESHPERHYTGLTSDLKERLDRHNRGDVPHTAKFAPWRIEIAVAFRDEAKARAFEIYLKSHSGRAFSQKHF